MFSDVIKSLPISDWVSESLFVTKSTVENCLRKDHFGIEDLAILISPAAESYIETIAQKSAAITKQRFGNIIQVFIPMYLSNECFNTCTYCGFSMEHKYERRTLNNKEICADADVLYKKGFQHILLLTGESPKKVGVDYIANAVKLLTDKFPSIGIEVQPLQEVEYEKLIKAGASSLTLYQETYHHDSYLKYHLFGIKRQYDKRLDALEAGAKAGFHTINMGTLSGLYDWRYDSIALAHHVDYMMKHYWKAKYAVSFPRINDMVGDFDIKYPTTDIALVQMICAFRLIFPDIIITLSTRESAALRDSIIPLGVTQISAESKTSPGAYSEVKAEKQFEIEDQRSLGEIKKVLHNKGYETVMKDWDYSLNTLKN
ncbi:2-iminoacetate synthase ThiH [Candidatus Marinamargulisbacteria bacterium SCGC AG-414-C22]|nr:2-iminoacetate synthase ThiH [Candidatus Marinamargulisbacteria bacterium SCGC AG-414-C22]